PMDSPNQRLAAAVSEMESDGFQLSQVVATQLQAHTANITAQVQNAVAATTQQAQGTIILQLHAHFAPTMQRVEGHELAIGDIQRKQNGIEDTQKALREDIKRINHRLALSEESHASVDIARLAEFDRDPHPTIFTINAPDDVPPSEVRGAIGSWISDANLDVEGTVLHGR
ncbi:unnamed protein product, partial [Prorocentrum cordatum]